MQPDRVSDIVQFLRADLLEGFAGSGELLIDFDSFFGHQLMSFLRAAEKDEILAGGDPFMAIGIQSDAEQESFAARFAFRGVGHGWKG